MKQMEARLLFNDPNGRDLAIAELTKRGFEVELLDAVDEWEGVVLSPTVWIKVEAPPSSTNTGSSTRWRS